MVMQIVAAYGGPLWGGWKCGRRTTYLGVISRPSTVSRETESPTRTQSLQARESDNNVSKNLRRSDFIETAHQ